MKDKNRLGGWFSKVVELVLAEMIDNAGPQGVAEDIDRRSEPVKQQSFLFSSFSFSLVFCSISFGNCDFFSLKIIIEIGEWSSWTWTMINNSFLLLPSDHTGNLLPVEQPVDSEDDGDILRRQPNSLENHHHGDKTSLGNEYKTWLGKYIALDFV